MLSLGLGLALALALSPSRRAGLFVVGRDLTSAAAACLCCLRFLLAYALFLSFSSLVIRPFPWVGGGGGVGRESCPSRAMLSLA